jgi:hypothetical protein
MLAGRRHQRCLNGQDFGRPVGSSQSQFIQFLWCMEGAATSVLPKPSVIVICRERKLSLGVNLRLERKIIWQDFCLL